MPVGVYGKTDFLIRGLKSKKKNGDLDEFGLSNEILKKPKYNDSVYDLTALAKQYVFSMPSVESNSKTNNTSNGLISSAQDQTHNLKKVNTAIDLVAEAPSYPLTAIDVGRKLGFVHDFSMAEREAMKASNFAMKEAGIVKPSNYFQMGNTYEKQFTVPKGLTTAGEVATGVGRALNAVGGVTSAVGLGFDVAKAIEDKKVTRENAFKIADDATGIVAAVATEINPLAGLAIGLGEKLVTGVVKGALAVKDLKEKEGKDYKPVDGFNAFVGANTPDWWGIGIGTPEWKQYWKKDKEQKAEAKKQAKEEKAREKATRKKWKDLNGKEKAERFFFGW